MKNRAFTLIELLIVITIIGILAVSFAPKLLNAPSLARDQKRIEDLQTLAGVLIQEEDDNIFTHSLLNNIGLGCVGSLALDIADFGGSIPVDPGSLDGNYGYVTSWCFTTNAAWQTTYGFTGGYLISTAKGPLGSDYSYILSAGMENFENANSTCNPNTIRYGYGLVEPDEDYSSGNCYVIQIQ